MVNYVKAPSWGVYKGDMVRHRPRLVVPSAPYQAVSNDVMSDEGSRCVTVSTPRGLKTFPLHELEVDLDFRKKHLRFE